MALVLEVNEVEDLLPMGRREEPVHGDEIHLVLGQRKAVTGEPLGRLDLVQAPELRRRFTRFFGRQLEQVVGGHLEKTGKGREGHIPRLAPSDLPIADIARRDADLLRELGLRHPFFSSERLENT